MTPTRSNRGGHREAGPGKTIGRPKKNQAAKSATATLRRDAAYDVLALLNTPEKKRSQAIEKASGEAKFVIGLILDPESKDKRFKWDVYRYMKECVDNKPMQKTEERVIFDPTKPLRVLVQHIGTIKFGAGKSGAGSK